MDGPSILAGLGLLMIFGSLALFGWLDWKHGPKAGARKERGHGIVHSDRDRG